MNRKLDFEGNAAKKRQKTKHAIKTVLLDNDYCESSKMQALGQRLQPYALRDHSYCSLGFEISKGQRQLGTDRKEAICSIPKPKNVHELRAFLGMAGWCRLWIMNYGLIAKPLYEAQKVVPFVWGPEQQKAFLNLKQALMTAPALGLPDLTKDFQLFVHERQPLALGVLTQKMGSWKRPVGYFSKQLGTVSKEWPTCLRAVAATVMLIQEARKLTLGRTITVYVPHMVITVLEQKGGHWLSPSRRMKYQVILTEQDDVILKTTNLINPADFLNSVQEEGQIEHDCLVTIEHVYSSREDLNDRPLEDPDWELYTDGSSFVEDGIRYAGYAVTTENCVVEANSLPRTTSAQKAELIALTRALELSEGKKVNIWTDSKYAFGVVHVHGVLWKERGLLSSQGTSIKYQEEILKLIQAVQKLIKVAIMHCKAVFIEERPVILEAKALATTPATKPGVDLHDASTSARTPIPDLQDRGGDHLCPQGSEVLLDLAQAMLYRVIGAHVEKK
ncbi:uncharacterized protein LOC143172258 [Aptenodytes patagonicus]|uniref:uncharacterized protein LOC143172258 n=1 Tax=Aptenodytes patagonicus TaxID=9234 RepID=UPI003FA12784